MKIYYVNLSYFITNLWFWMWILNLQEWLPQFLEWPKETNISTKKIIMLDIKLLMKQLKLNMYPLLKTLLTFLPNLWPLQNLILWEKILFPSMLLEITDQFEMTSNWERYVMNPVQLSSIQFDAILLLCSSNWSLLFLFLSFPFLCCIFPLVLFSLFLFFLMFILSLPDLILFLFPSTKTLFLCFFLFLLQLHFNCLFTALTFLSLEQMFTLFVFLNKSTFLIWSLVWLCFCFVCLFWDPVDLINKICFSS